MPALTGLWKRRGTVAEIAADDQPRPAPVCTPYLSKDIWEDTRLVGQEYEKPWLIVKNPRRKWERILFWCSIATGFLVGAALCYLSYASVTNLTVRDKTFFSSSQLMVCSIA